MTNKTEIMTPRDLGNTYHVANAFIAVVPNHPIMDYCIKEIVSNVENNVNYPDKRNIAGLGVFGKCTNKHLNRPETNNINFSNTDDIEYLQLLEFKRLDEYVTNQDCSKYYFKIRMVIQLSHQFTKKKSIKIIMTFTGVDETLTYNESK